MKRIRVVLFTLLVLAGCTLPTLVGHTSSGGASPTAGCSCWGC